MFGILLAGGGRPRHTAPVIYCMNRIYCFWDSSSTFIVCSWKHLNKITIKDPKTEKYWQGNRKKMRKTNINSKMSEGIMELISNGNILVGFIKSTSWLCISVGCGQLGPNLRLWVEGSLAPDPGQSGQQRGSLLTRQLPLASSEPRPASDTQCPLSSRHPVGKGHKLVSINRKQICVCCF